MSGARTAIRGSVDSCAAGLLDAHHAARVTTIIARERFLDEVLCINVPST
jgi:hypothetical protein